MPKVALYNQNGSTAGDIELNASVFGIEPNESVVFDAILMQRASLRQGTHKVKNRSEVRGGGRKPWRQKGTGRARQGSIRSPQWRGGGVVFGPTPRSYSYKLPKKVRRLAIKSVLSSKVIDNNIIVLEDLTLDTAKTKEMAAILKGLSVEKKASFLTNLKKGTLQKRKLLLSASLKNYAEWKWMRMKLVRKSRLKFSLLEKS